VTHRLLIEQVPLERVVPLRAEVLRDGDTAAAVWSDDDHPQAVHLAASVGDEIVGVTSYFPDLWPDLPSESAWRVRGVAVGADRRGAGVGSALIAEVVRRALTPPERPERLWCNARTTALNFWRRAGFDIVGAEFRTETGIPHFRAVRLLNQ
jgi:GNAT superfamily N-acetyltransferase